MARNEIDAIKFNQDLCETFHRYLYTTNMITEKEPELRDAFLGKLGDEFKVIAGPFVNCQPSYKQSISLSSLVAGGAGISVPRELLSLDCKEFDVNRPLYSHQVESFKRLASGKSVVVATGTGSGKTESFLLPILGKILENPGSGLRAILIYPMNALADDQLIRLRSLLKGLPEISFGRYTGDTEQSIPPAQRRGYLDNERVSRDEIRSNPPNILVTNFAMLEYLLLRPRDSALFSNHALKYVVLDEAHTYSGAQGIEVSLLMRRLRQYLGLRIGDLHFALTSATLGDDEKALEKVAVFASHLSGVEFGTQDILQGEHVDTFDVADQEIPSLGQLVSITSSGPSFTAWEEALADTGSLCQLLRDAGFSPATAEGQKPPKVLHDLFKNSRLLARVHDLCRSRPSSLAEIAVNVGLEANVHGEEAVRWLVTMGSFARPSEQDAPLLPARLHYFCRGLSGATICLNEKCQSLGKHIGTGWSELYLEDRNSCEHCESLVMPLLSCTHCGLPVARVYLANGKWRKQEERDTRYETCLLTWNTDSSEDWDEGLSGGGDDDGDSSTFTVCLSCGAASPGTLERDCCATPRIRTLMRIADNEGNLPRCVSCGGTGGSYKTVLREFRTSEDAPTAVLAEIIMRNLPYDRNDPEKQRLPAHGRNLLAFSDSRQRAAFFAPYLGQTTADSAFMGPLEKAILAAETSAGGPVSFEEVRDEYLRLVETMNVAVLRKRGEEENFYELVPTAELARVQRRELGKEVEKTLYRNFCSSQKQKTTLLGMGIAGLVIDFSGNFGRFAESSLPELFAKGEEHGHQLLSALLDIIIQRIAVEFPDHVSVKPDIVSFGPPLYTFHGTEAGRAGSHPAIRQRYRWNPYHAPKRSFTRAVKESRQLDLLCKVLSQDKFRDQAFLSDLLDRVWNVFTQHVMVGSQWGGEYRVNPVRILLSTKLKWFSCNKCGLLTNHGLLGVCPARGCQGETRELDVRDKQVRFENNHYRQRYRQEPLPLVVKEHTAQLASKIAKSYQKDFMDGKVNILSSSTTFEMGIDVGDLKSVLLRNVPPVTSSYIQRVGRAGRRKDGISLAVTYTRNIPHDQFHFNNPAAMIRGIVPAPYLNPSNQPLAQRHANSLLLGYFLRELDGIDPDELGRLTVQGFFLVTRDNRNSLSSSFVQWCEGNKPRLAGYLDDAFSGWQGMQSTQMIDEGAKTLADLKARISKICADFRRDIEKFREEFPKATEAQERTRITKCMNSLQKLLEQYEGQRLIDYLSSECWLPGYAFPQDNVKLLVRHPAYADKLRLERDREIGISEYAPGAEIIADGKSFKSAGLWFNSQEPEIWWYACCPSCRSIERTRETERPPASCSKCGTFLSLTSRCLRPDAFSTAVMDEAALPTLSRARPPRTSEIFLLEGAIDFTPHHDCKGVDCGKKANGLLMRVNRGYKFKGFNICMACGTSLQAPGPHLSPWGSRCNGQDKALDLAHEIKTDICQLRFSRCAPPAPLLVSENRAFWLSFTQAFLHGATDALGISPSDIDGTFHGWEQGDLKGELVIYDRIPGGAGHIDNILENLETVLRAALHRVENCACGDLEASCYACLRGFGNQFDWPDLKRKPVIDWLSGWL